MVRNLEGARVTVYCAGSARVASHYLDGATELAKELVGAGATLVLVAVKPASWATLPLR